MSARSRFQKTDLHVHVHVPEGAVPKDGPSAGIAMATALVSALSGKAVRSDVAMTGEVTLREQACLRSAGSKKKLIAAQRDGMKGSFCIRPAAKKIFPGNPAENVRKSLKLIPVDDIDQVFEHALLSLPVKATAAPQKVFTHTFCSH